MRFRLRTLLIVLALGPPMLTGLVYVAVTARDLYNCRTYENDPPLQHYGVGATEVEHPPSDLQ